MRCRFRGTLKVETCLERQKKARRIYAIGLSKFTECRDCETGKLAKAGKLDDLDYWDLMKRYKEEHGMDNATKICKQCGEEKDLEAEYHKNKATKDGHENVCRSCKSIEQKKRREKQKAKREELSKRSAERKQRDREKIEKRKAAPVAPGQDKTEASFQVVIDFSRYPELFEKIKQIAENEERDIDRQVLYWLRNQVAC